MSRISKLIYFISSLLFFITINFYATMNIVSQNFIPALNPVFDFVFIENTGAAFSLFQDKKSFLIIFAIFALAGIILYTVKHLKDFSVMLLFFISMLCSGIFCNLYERASLGHVRDYIKLKFIDFPVFNISDIFINISVFIIVIIIIKNNYFKNSNENND